MRFGQGSRRRMRPVCACCARNSAASVQLGGAFRRAEARVRKGFTGNTWYRLVVIPNPSLLISTFQGDGQMGMRSSVARRRGAVRGRNSRARGGVRRAYRGESYAGLRDYGHRCQPTAGSFAAAAPGHGRRAHRPAPRCRLTGRAGVARRRPRHRRQRRDLQGCRKRSELEWPRGRNCRRRGLLAQRRAERPHGRVRRIRTDLSRWKSVKCLGRIELARCCHVCELPERELWDFP